MEKDEVELSVIIPVYNEEQYIEECVQSILIQKAPNLEIILVDDGSIDRSGMLCDQLSKKNDCVHAIHIENGGISKARLAGATLSKGKWITFVDADDWIGEEAYKDIIEENDCDIVITGICRYVNKFRQIMQNPYFSEGIYNKEDIEKEILPTMLWTSELGVWALDPSLCTKIFRREIIIKYLDMASEVGSDYGEDSMVIFPMMLEVKCVRILKRIYYYHRQRAAGIISPYIQDEKYFLKIYNVYRYLEGKFKNTAYWDLMRSQLDRFYISAVELKKRCFDYPNLEFAVYFPIDRISKESNVVLYGAGEVGKQYWMQNLKYQFCNIVSWVDKKYEKRQTEGYKIESPEIVKRINFDYIIIAVDNYNIAKEIAVYLNRAGVKNEKVVWHSVRVNRKKFENIFDEA